MKFKNIENIIYNINKLKIMSKIKAIINMDSKILEGGKNIYQCMTFSR
jgi:hypothetical protein